MIVLTLFALIALLVPSPSPASISLAQQDAASILEASAAAMENVGSMRFNGSVAINMASEGMTMNMAIPVSGAYVAPDRMRLAIAGSTLGVDGEMILIGDELWMRTGEAGWTTAGAGTGGMRGLSMGAGMHPSMITRPTSSEIAQFISEMSLSDQGGNYLLTGRIDLAQLMAETLGEDAMLGQQMMSDEMDSLTTEVNFTVNKATLYTENVAFVMGMSAPAAGSQGDMNVTINFEMFDFDSPDITIEAPDTEAPM
jgi:hypothetical protein